MKTKHIFPMIALTAGFFSFSPLLSVPGTGISLTSKANAQSYASMSCGQLWYERNAIYARQGYCFKTARAQRAFPRSCHAPWGRLSYSQQNRVNSIVYWERRYGCPR
ncbi:YARHG domain-containing protein [uncultured Cohaesibacter sp.]|uniref:YARHG domain-containing protein n=1 Tax=uncultured Cohaesibacter sp. TaxID=1002546 RepID=UPI00292D615D|nr:YARHG domain-containing protein [uncultured Cohaesibacter sp.]